MESLMNEVLEDLTDVLGVLGTSDAVILESKIKNAIREVKLKRNYQEYHTEDFINGDMEKMYPIIQNLSLYDFNQTGAEGQLSHSENGTSRTWRSRDEILLKIIPFATIF